MRLSPIKIISLSTHASLLLPIPLLEAQFEGYLLNCSLFICQINTSHKSQNFQIISLTDCLACVDELMINNTRIIKIRWHCFKFQGHLHFLLEHNKHGFFHSNDLFCFIPTNPSLISGDDILKKIFLAIHLLPKILAR